MKRHTETCFKVLLMLLLTALAMTQASAQPDDTALFEPVTDTPINTGIALMAAAGIGYGLKKLKSHKK
jgi:hypothetical protein